MKTIILILVTLVNVSAFAQTNLVPKSSRTILDLRSRIPSLTNCSDSQIVLTLVHDVPDSINDDPALALEYQRYSAKINGHPVETPQIQKTIMALDGQIYRDIVITKVQPDGIIISSMTTNGLWIGKLKFYQLPKWIRDYYGYDEALALNFEIEQQQAFKDAQAKGFLYDNLSKNAASIRAQQDYEAQQQRLAFELKNREIRAKEREADAAMLQALKPPVEVNVQQNNYRW